MTGRPRSAMVLAAGLGLRMRPLTEDRPKPLVEVAGRALIDHALDHLAGAGVRLAVVNLHYRGDQLRAHLASRARPAIRFSDEPALLDTGGGVRKARPLLGAAPVFVVNSDAIFAGPPPLETLAAAWEDAGTAGALLLLVPRHRAIGHAGAGDFDLGADARPLRRRRGAEAEFVYTGAQILRPEALDGPETGAFSLNLVWDRLAEAGRLAAAVYPGDWVDVGTPAGVGLAEVALARAAAAR